MTDHCALTPHRGFTLIEVLVSMMVLAVGLLGLASLQTLALRQSQDATLMQQAILLATSMQARIRANADVNWATVSPNAADSCTKNIPCTQVQLAANDYGQWTREARQSLTANAHVTIQLSREVNTPPCISTAPGALCLVTTWPRVDTKTTGFFSKNATFYLEILP